MLGFPAALAAATGVKSTTGVTHLSGAYKAVTVGIVVVFVLLACLVVVIGRRCGGLLIFVAVSFWLDDTTLRSTLVGGVVANAGAAVAFYFASKSSDQARRDILSAALPTALLPNLAGKDRSAAQEAVAAVAGPVPDLTDLTPERAHAKLTAVGLQLDPNPPQPAADSAVSTQEPTAGSSSQPT